MRKAWRRALARTVLAWGGGAAIVAAATAAETGAADAAAHEPAAAPAAISAYGAAAPVQPAAAGTPALVSVVRGQGQSAPVNSTLPVAPMVKVMDNLGIGVPGVQVQFRVVNGGGSITGIYARTNAQGIARVGSWTLGPVAGRQRLSASTPGLPEAVVAANALAQGPRLMAPEASDHQMAPVGAVLPRVPAVFVLDAAGRPVAGVPVTFAPGQGGRVARLSVVSDANGRAAPGAWTLGPGQGLQTLSVSASGYAGLDLVATALPAGAPTLVREVVLRGVYEVWDMAFAPGGVMLYTERGRGLWALLPGGERRLLFKPADFVTATNSGMLGVALDPDFAANRRVFVFMASNAAGVPDNRVVRVRVKPDWSGVEARKDIVTGIAFQNRKGLEGEHSGGALAFVGTDLIISSGDLREGTVPQDVRSLGGKVLRVDREGRPAAAARAPVGGDERIWVTGVRNPQGLAVQPGTQRPYLIEHGPGDNDEVTPLRAGNGGWDPRPRPLGGATARCPDGQALSYCGYAGSNMTDTALYPAALPPAWRSGLPARGTGGGSFVSGAAWKDWDGALVIGQLSGRRLLVLQLDAGGNAVRAATPLLQDVETRLRNVAQGPDGALYISTSSDNNRSDRRTQVWRLVPR
ncbi:PQQ-dependent sugar dehydrogenase [Azohydromonas aeria]|uniref:PQQ-dependent sugar dehydrogenase n=1 Tax=Azohydromonas aeria TaxID=2590212 RepID=UPI0012FBA912|nr:PQQ-dependent sugar dehydrogenase [Azohydromonas aeria]